MQPAHLIRTANNGQPASLLKGVVFAPLRDTGDKLLPGNGLPKSSQDTSVLGAGGRCGMKRRPGPLVFMDSFVSCFMQTSYGGLCGGSCATYGGLGIVFFRRLD